MSIMSPCYGSCKTIVKRIATAVVAIFAMAPLASTQGHYDSHVRYRDQSVTTNPGRSTRVAHQSGAPSVATRGANSSKPGLNQQLAKLESETRRTNSSVKAPRTPAAKPTKAADQKTRSKSMNFSRPAGKTGQNGRPHRAASL